MTKNTITTLILIGLILVGFTGWGIAQNNVDKANEIIEVDKQIIEHENILELHKQGYHISMQASEECKESFVKDAEKEHVAADKEREIIKQLYEKREGLIMNR